MTGAIPDPVNAFFEICSGFSTTGATIMTNIEEQAKSVLFWRSFTHWLGGMGIIVFATALSQVLYVSIDVAVKRRQGSMSE